MEGARLYAHIVFWLTVREWKIEFIVSDRRKDRRSVRKRRVGHSDATTTSKVDRDAAAAAKPRSSSSSCESQSPPLLTSLFYLHHHHQQSSSCFSKVPASGAKLLCLLFLTDLAYKRITPIFMNEKQRFSHFSCEMISWNNSELSYLVR